MTMTDLVFAVRDPIEWHRANMAKHVHHYSLLGSLGPHVVAALQEGLGAQVYYNAMVGWRGRLIKYGVVSVSSLVDDLTCWSHLYLAGRMHKPIQTLVTEARVEAAAQSNLRSAVAAALLLQPSPSFVEADLFSTICSLSYTGDPRQALVEATKPEQIAEAQAPALRALYDAPIREVNALLRSEQNPPAEGACKGHGVKIGGSNVEAQCGERQLASVKVLSTEDRQNASAFFMHQIAGDEPAWQLSPALEARLPLLELLPEKAKAELTAEIVRRLTRSPNRNDAQPQESKGWLGLSSMGLKERGNTLENGAWARSDMPAQVVGSAAQTGGCPLHRIDARPRQSQVFEAVNRLYTHAGNEQQGARALAAALKTSLGKIVRRSSTSQTLKGALTGGVLTTVRYVAAKIGKKNRA